MDRPSAALRIGLIALVALGFLAVSFHEARFLPSLPVPRLFRRAPDFLEALPGGFPVLDQDVALAAEPVFINGREVTSVRLASPLPPAALTAAYARRLQPLGYACVPGAPSARKGGDFVHFRGEGQSMLGFRDPEGFPMGIVAFSNAETGGSDYFITRERDLPAEGAGPWNVNEDGGDPPGVFLPADAEREYCIEKKGAFPSWLVLYRSWTAPTMVAHQYRARMPDQGWREPEGAAEAFPVSPGSAQLLFHRGPERAMIHVAETEDGEGSWITVAFRRGRH